MTLVITEALYIYGASQQVCGSWHGLANLMHVPLSGGVKNLPNDPTPGHAITTGGNINQGMY